MQAELERDRKPSSHTGKEEGPTHLIEAHPALWLSAEMQRRGGGVRWKKRTLVPRSSLPPLLDSPRASPSPPA
jgi:hypothetical protein